MSEEQDDSIINSPRVDTALDIAAIVAANFVPYPLIGSVIASVLNGVTTDRKIKRVRDVLDRVARDLRKYKDHVNETYVRSEDFEDIVEKALTQAAAERHTEKRDMYAAFLLDTITAPDPQYDDQLTFLRMLDGL